MHILRQYKWFLIGIAVVGSVVTGIFILKKPPVSVPAVEYYTSRTTPYVTPVNRDMLERNSEHTQASVVPPVVPELPKTVNDQSGGLMLSVAGINTGGRLPLDYTCYRSNKSPALTWSGVPQNAKSIVVMFEDVQETNASLYWSVYNIPVTLPGLARSLPTDPVVEGVGLQGKNLTGNTGYTGPCLPKGKFPFVVRIYALDALLDIPAAVDQAALITAMKDHVLDQAEFPMIHYYKF